MATDNLGITELEDKQIAALKAGASREDVASLSRMPIDKVPREIPVTVIDEAEIGPEGVMNLYGDDSYTPDEQEISLYEPSEQVLEEEEEESLYEPTLPPMDSSEAATKSLNAALAEDPTEVTTAGSYSSMYDEFTTLGDSAKYNSIRSTIAKVRQADINAAIMNAAKEGDVDLTEALILRQPVILRKESAIRTVAMENVGQDYADSVGDTTTREIEEAFINGISPDVSASGETSAEIFNRVVNRTIATNSDSLVPAFGGLLESFFLGEQTLGLAAVGKDMFGERYNFLGGSLLRDLAQDLQNTPVEELEAKMEKLADSVSRHAGVIYGHDNDYVKTFFLENLREFYNTPGGDIPLDRVLGNVFGALEVPGLAVSLAPMKILKAVKKSGLIASKAKNVKPGLATVNPDVDAVIDAAALKDPALAAKLGTTPAETAAKIIPSPKFDSEIALEGASPEVIKVMEGVKTRAQVIQDRVDNTFIYRSADYEAKNKELIDILTKDEVSGQVKPSNSTYEILPNTNEMRISAIYGDQTATPLTYRDAIKLATKLNTTVTKEDGFDNKSLTLMVRDDTTSSFVKYDKTKHSKDGLFYVRVDSTYRMMPTDAVGHIPLSEGATKAVGSVVGEYLGRFVRTAEQWLDRTLYSATNVGLDAKGLYTNEMRAVVSPFTSLKWASKKKVSDVLLRGDAEEKVFTYKELKEDIGLTDKEISGYFSARYLEDLVYNEKNMTERHRLVREGYKGVYAQGANGQPFITAGKEVDIDTFDFSKTKRVFNPYTGGYEDIDLTKAKKLKAQGMTLVKPLKEVDINGAIYKHILTKADDFDELPARVLAHRKGHITRINKEPYYIDEMDWRSVDGVRVEDSVKTIHVAKSFKEAKRTVAELKRIAARDGKTASYTLRLDRNIDNGDTILKLDTNTLSDANLNYWFSGRGTPLKTLAGELGAIENPMYSINHTIATVANTKAYNELIASALTRHKKTYGHLKDVNNEPLWVTDPKMGSYFDTARANVFGEPEVAAALAEHRAIEALKYTPGWTSKAWTGLLKGINRTLMPGEFGTAAMKNLANYDPVQVARAVTFSMTIPLRFTRHLLLQPITSSHLFGIDPKLTSLAYRDALGICLGMMAKNDPQWYGIIKRSSILLGMKPQEFEDLLEAFRKSGKAYSIDSHVAIGEVNFAWSKEMADTALGNIGQKALNAIKSPITIGKMIGFDTGELVHQAATYAFTYRKWQKDNPGKVFTKRVADKITDDARAYSVNMTSTAQFSYQKGALAVATQFLAISHKMAINLLGMNPYISHRNGKYSAAAHMRYATGMMAMFGASGLGLHTVYDKWIKESGVELPPEVDNAVHGGFWSFLFNTSLDLAFGRELGTNRLDIGGSVSPASGAWKSPKDFVENLFKLDVGEALSGASGKVLPNFQKAYTEVKQMWAVEDDLNTPEKLLESFQIAWSQFGIFSDIQKYNMTMKYRERMGELVTTDRNGRPLAIANTAEEIFTKAMFGIQTRAEAEVYNTALPMYRDYNTSSKKFKTDFDKDVDNLTKYMYKTFFEEEDPLIRVKKMQAITFTLHGADPRSTELYRAAREKFIAETNFDRFSAEIVKRYGQLDPGADIEAMKNAARASDALREDEKFYLVDYFNQLEKSLQLDKLQYDIEYSEYK